MPTINQLVITGRIFKKHTNNNKFLINCPQKKGICIKPRIMAPKKPNSAKRKIAKMKIISAKKSALVYIPGQGHTLKSYSVALISGGRANDVPGVRFSLVRGWKRGDFKEESALFRQNKRSKYGARKK